jgi:hypothetical protein
MLDDDPLSEDPSIDKSASTSVASLHCRRFRIWFLVLLLISVLGNAMLPWVVECVAAGDYYRPGRVSRSEIIGATLMGGFLSQLGSMGSWMALSTWPGAYRILFGLLIGILCPIMLVIGLTIVDGGEPPMAAFLVMAIAGPVIVLGVGALMRLFFHRKKLSHPQDAANNPVLPAMGKQFDMRFLLAVMIAVALITQLIRVTLPTSSESWLDDVWQYALMAAWFVWLIVGLAILVGLLAKVFFERPSWVNRVTLIACFLLGPLAFQVFSSYVLFNPAYVNTRLAFTIDAASILYAYLITTGLVLGQSLAFGGTRWMGYRFPNDALKPNDSNTARLAAESQTQMDVPNPQSSSDG